MLEVVFASLSDVDDYMWNMSMSLDPIIEIIKLPTQTET